MTDPASCSAFDGPRLIARGPLAEVAVAAKAAGPGATVLVFDDATGRVIDLDLRGTPDEIAARHAAITPPRTRGRPKLGVVAREITLLPRHWEWLNAQAGGASQALRRLIDEARRTDDGRTGRRLAQEAAYRFMSAMAGDLPGFEEAARALFADDRARLRAEITAWPRDIGDHVEKLAWP